MRFAVDTGGTFTDLLVETDDHALATFKASTTPANPITGVMDALGLAATGLGLSLGGLLGRGESRGSGGRRRHLGRHPR